MCASWSYTHAPAFASLFAWLDVFCSPPSTDPIVTFFLPSCGLFYFLAFHFDLSMVFLRVTLFFLFAILGFELRAYTLSHSISPFL
jgi:hypothetical protein